MNNCSKKQTHDADCRVKEHVPLLKISLGGVAPRLSLKAHS